MLPPHPKEASIITDQVAEDGEAIKADVSYSSIEDFQIKEEQVEVMTEV